MSVKGNRLHHYQRVRSADECARLLSKRIPVKVAFEVTDQWFEAPGGRIALPGEGDHIVGSHSVLLLDLQADRREFLFVNTWGVDWGDEGFGCLPWEFFDRHLIESWVPVGYGVNPPCRPGQGIQDLSWESPDVFGGTLYGREIFDSTNDERIGWAFAVTRGASLDLEEFFVMPAHRGKGYGRRLAQMVNDLARQLRLKVCVWIPFSDADSRNLGAIEFLASTLNLAISESGVRWACLKGLQRRHGETSLTGPEDSRKSLADLIARARIPERPASVRTLKAGIAALSVATAMGFAGSGENPSTAEQGVAASSPARHETESVDYEDHLRQAFEKYGPLYERLADSGRDRGGQDQGSQDESFDQLVAETFAKYDDLYHRLA